MLKLNEEKLLERWRHAKSSTSSDPGSELFAAISRLSSEISSVEDLLEMAHSFEFSVTDHLVKELRRKYQACELILQTIVLVHRKSCFIGNYYFWNAINTNGRYNRS